MYVDFGHCGADPCSAEQRAQETESRKDVSLPELKKIPLLDLSTCRYAQNAGTCLHLVLWKKRSDYSNSGKNADANTHSAYKHTFLSHPSIFWSLYPTHLRHLTMSRCNSWREENAIIPAVTQQLSETAWWMRTEPLLKLTGLFYSCYLWLDLCSVLAIFKAGYVLSWWSFFCTCITKLSFKYLLYQ